MNPPSQEAVLRTQDVVKTYRRGSTQLRALDGVTMSVAPGEFLSVMGPSGSGKSTLLHLMGALDRPDSGDVFLDEHALSSLSDDALSDLRRRRIGFVFQQFNLLPTLTAFENAALPLLLDGALDNDAAAYVRQMLEAVGVAERLDHKPDEMSGGEMQRVAIARALATKPSIVLADEPTGNLDSKTGEEILALLKQTQAERDLTVVLVTHDARAAAYGDRILTVKDGRIAEEVSVLGTQP